MSKINIAIDGPVASGKGTVAKLLTKRIGYNYLDTGAMYRALALWMNRNNISLESFNEDLLANIKIDFNEENDILLNGENVSELIRTPLISKLSSEFSTLIPVRLFLVKQQQEIVKNGGYVAEGRDIGTVVIPDAKVKIYLTASLDERARRRQEDYKNKGIEKSFEEVKEETYQRDETDKNKEMGALKKADDAIEIDNSNMSIEYQLEKIINLVNNC